MNPRKRVGKKDISVGLAYSELVQDKEFIDLKEIYDKLKLKHKLSEIFEISEKKEVFIPLSIFNKQLSGLEVISKYLIEEKNLSLKQISKL